MILRDFLKSSVSPFVPKRKDIRKDVLSFWAPAAGGDLHPSVIQMLGGSTRKGYATSVRRQSRQRLCGEFRLRRGFACGKTLVRRIGAAGQKAGWVVLLYLFEISCGRNVRFAATSFYTCGKKEVIRPIPAPPLQPRPALRAAFTIEKPSTLTVLQLAASIPCFRRVFVIYWYIMTKGAAYGH